MDKCWPKYHILSSLILGGTALSPALLHQVELTQGMRVWSFCGG